MFSLAHFFIYRWILKSLYLGAVEQKMKFILKITRITTKISKSYHSNLQQLLSLSQRGVLEGGWGWRVEVGWTERDGWRIGRRRQTRAMQGWLRLSGIGDSGRCITSDISIPADAGLSLCPTHTCTHAQTHASKLIEASGFVPHQAQGVMTTTLFPPISPLLSSTHAHSHANTHRYIYTYIRATLSPTLLCSLKCQAGGGLCRVPPESNKSWLELKQLVRPPRLSICWITVSQPVICEMKASTGGERRGHGRGQRDWTRDRRGMCEIGRKRDGAYRLV